MYTAQIEEKIFTEFTNDKNLMELLNNDVSSIFHIRAPSVYPDYPILVYSVTNDVPSLHADDEEKFHSVDLRIHIVASEPHCPEIYVAVKKIMLRLGFVRLQTTEYLDEDGKFILVTDWTNTFDDN